MQSTKWRMFEKIANLKRCRRYIIEKRTERSPHETTKPFTLAQLRNQTIHQTSAYFQYLLYYFQQEFALYLLKWTYLLIRCCFILIKSLNILLSPPFQIRFSCTLCNHIAEIKKGPFYDMLSDCNKGISSCGLSFCVVPERPLSWSAHSASHSSGTHNNRHHVPV